MIYFTSDEHYDHANVIKFCGRPFGSVAHMQAELIRRHNAVVTDDDVVWHLGDFALNKKTVPVILPQLNGRHVLVAGNHDACHPSKKSYKNAKSLYLLAGFTHIHDLFVEEPGAPWGPTLLSHMPPADEDTRYPNYRPKLSDLPAVLLHGHVHDRYKHRRLEVWDACADLINVGVDVWDYAPVSIDTLAGFIAWIQTQ